MRQSIFLFLLALLAGCESEVKVIETVGQLKGTIIGVTQLSSAGVVTPPYNGIKVTLEGTNFSALSGEDGYWQLNDVPAGTYVISYEKEGYGTRKTFGYQFVGGGTAYFPPYVELQKVFTTHVQFVHLAVKDTVEPGYPSTPIEKRIVGKAYIPDPFDSYYSYGAVFFFGKTPNVSSDITTYDFAIIKLLSNVTDSMFSFSRGHFTSGEIYYVAAYGGYFPGGTADYYDPELRRYRYTSISPHKSEVFRFVAP